MYMAISKYTYGEIESIDNQFNKLARKFGVPESTSPYLKQDFSESFVSDKDRSHAKELYNKYSYNELHEGMTDADLSQRAVKKVACTMNRPTEYIQEALLSDSDLDWMKNTLRKNI